MLSIAVGSQRKNSSSIEIRDQQDALRTGPKVNQAHCISTVTPSISQICQKQHCPARAGIGAMIGVVCLRKNRSWKKGSGVGGVEP
jgi:hypothetical protein